MVTITPPRLQAHQGSGKSLPRANEGRLTTRGGIPSPSRPARLSLLWHSQQHPKGPDTSQTTSLQGRSRAGSRAKDHRHHHGSSRDLLGSSPSHASATPPTTRSDGGQIHTHPMCDTIKKCLGDLTLVYNVLWRQARTRQMWADVGERGWLGGQLTASARDGTMFWGTTPIRQEEMRGSWLGEARAATGLERCHR